MSSKCWSTTGCECHGVLLGARHRLCAPYPCSWVVTGAWGFRTPQMGPAGAGQSPCVPAEGDALPLHPATPWHEPGAPGKVLVVGAQLDTGRLGAQLCTPRCWGEGAAGDAKTLWAGRPSFGGAASQETQRGADPGAPLVQGESGHGAAPGGSGVPQGSVRGPCDAAVPSPRRRWPRGRSSAPTT